MNFIIYLTTGVRPPKASPASLRSLGNHWETVRRAAVTCKAEADDAVAYILSNNQGRATGHFEAYATGSDSSSSQLTKLADAALATRDAHNEAASIVESTKTSMDAVAGAAARDILKLTFLPPVIKQYYQRQIINRARTQLTALLVAANIRAVAAYAAVSLPSTLGMSEAQARGSVPQDVKDAWKNMTVDERMRLLEAMADDVMSDWPADHEKPDIIYYSNQVPQPPGTIPPPGPDWNGYNGAAWKGDVYLNYDKLGDDPTLMHTVVHEVQHIHQGHMRDEYDDLMASDPQIIDDIRAGRRPDPFVEQGTTLDEVERWKEEYQSTSNPDQKPYYYHQPVEVDARRSGTEYLDHLTPEKMEELIS